MAGFVFNEQKFVNDNIFKFEDRLNSQYSRFLDKSPTYVTYYNISKTESTVDLGFSNIEELIGPNSPLKFKEIKDFPVYGIESIQFNLDDDEEGLNISFDSELIVLPNTIKPLPNDFFILNHLGKEFLFMVTGVDYDTIKSNNYYKLSYTIKSLDVDSTEKVKKQVTEVYNCVVENIGTEDKCLIREEEYDLLRKLWDTVDHIKERYITYFYNEKHNSFLYTDYKTGFKVYDRYLTHFIKSHNLFNDRGSFRTIMLSSEDESNDFFMEYDTSIYKVLELRKPNYLKEYKFVCTCIDDQYSSFNFYRNRKVKTVRFRYGNMCYLHEPLIRAMKEGKFNDEEPEVKPEPSPEPEIPSGPSVDEIMPLHIEEIDPGFGITGHECPEIAELDNLLVNYMHDKIDSIYNIDLEELDNMLYFDTSWDMFIKIPIAIYILKFYQKKFLRN